MEFKFANRILGVNPSAIREIMKITAMPDVISFAAGSPSADDFPVEALSAIAADIYKTMPAQALQYGASEGYGRLREITKERISKKFGIGRAFDDLLILSGGQQSVDLTAKCLLNEGDMVICENPSFVGALNTFRTYKAQLCGIEVDKDGMDVDALEHALKTNKNVKLIYTIPNFQNPSGVTMSMERRRRVYELAVKYDVVVLEDDPYGELRYSGDYVPPIKSLDETGHVIYSGSYSKIVAPGIRIGFAVCHKDLFAKIVVGKQATDVHSNMFFMMSVAKFLEEYDIEAHIKLCCDRYRVKRDIMLNAIESRFPASVSCTRPEGGLFIWCTLPKGISGYDVCAFAGQRKVACVPGSTFDVNENRDYNAFRLNFTVPTPEQINTGIGVLADALNDYLK